jgi:hypothetical protein
MIFPKEKPPCKDFLLWWETLFSMAPCGRLTNHIGHFTHEGNKIWPWQMDVRTNRHYHLKENSMDIYSLLTNPNLGHRPNSWMVTEVDMVRRETGDICLIKESTWLMNVLCHTQPSPPRRALVEFWDVIRE